MPRLPPTLAEASVSLLLKTDKDPLMCSATGQFPSTVDLKILRKRQHTNTGPIKLNSYGKIIRSDGSNILELIISEEEKVCFFCYCSAYNAHYANLRRLRFTSWKRCKLPAHICFCPRHGLEKGLGKHERIEVVMLVPAKLLPIKEVNEKAILKG